ncbi:similar to Saccharomyces cerevisiae YCL033C MXR2 Methionine-R-sulfoxide reductase, involved in the response to oxidative stress [Maudiozyma barnettii]|uniref:Peptide-methionine (R)-S-oxide reductase n=1 Tax=Maudiozyma barnettii TaxID=61262 RepID=A0A8H2ZFK2_9SACH|nr:peptide-methionine (R)-S-oxide reductase [Kazachstania barnettii]CAB4253331.1 similar to Saccharomyces cerevisiae YCL033C MXR2 Methionine-R-sulfoxide reductase, involved in the response to oxidative stress [Kazachstania barnettii]CAD1780854.1 similar to Saccharomyces cerevisiae YCL033C MXR2 Methionine-R-sulfoxide reductase, involved in the response to oxidative stress [Kazachstania barnettii]
MSFVSVAVTEMNRILPGSSVIRIAVTCTRSKYQLANRFQRRSLSYTSHLYKMVSNQEGWNPNLTPEQLNVLKDKGTERPGTGIYLSVKEKGVYHCANCDAPIYRSETKFDSSCGWPAFNQEISNDALTYHVDSTLGMERTEICCSKCGGHMGHVFKGEGWDKLLGLPKDERHCVNSLSLNFKKD